MRNVDLSRNLILKTSFWLSEFEPLRIAGHFGIRHNSSPRLRFSMPLLLRTSAQDAAYALQALQLIELATIFAQLNMFEECLLVLVAASASLEMTLQPSCSWATGINRVVIWSFENMYSPEECWEQLRFHKDDMPELLRQLPCTTAENSTDDGGIATLEVSRNTCSSPWSCW